MEKVSKNGEKTYQRNIYTNHWIVNPDFIFKFRNSSLPFEWRRTNYQNLKKKNRYHSIVSLPLFKFMHYLCIDKIYVRKKMIWHLVYISRKSWSKNNVNAVNLHWLCAIPVATKSSIGFFLSLMALTQSQQHSRTIFTPPSIDELIIEPSESVFETLKIY